MKNKAMLVLILSLSQLSLASAAELPQSKISVVMPASNPAAESANQSNLQQQEALSQLIDASKTEKIKNSAFPQATIDVSLDPQSNKGNFTLKIDKADAKTGARDITLKYKNKNYTVNLTAAQMESLPNNGLTFNVDGNESVKLSISYSQDSGFKYVISQVDIRDAISGALKEKDTLSKITGLVENKTVYSPSGQKTKTVDYGYKLEKGDLKLTSLTDARYSPTGALTARVLMIADPFGDLSAEYYKADYNANGDLTKEESYTAVNLTLGGLKDLNADNFDLIVKKAMVFYRTTYTPSGMLSQGFKADKSGKFTVLVAEEVITFSPYSQKEYFVDMTGAKKLYTLGQSVFADNGQEYKVFYSLYYDVASKSYVFGLGFEPTNSSFPVAVSDPMKTNTVKLGNATYRYSVSAEGVLTLTRVS